MQGKARFNTNVAIDIIATTATTTTIIIIIIIIAQSLSKLVDGHS